MNSDSDVPNSNMDILRIITPEELEQLRNIYKEHYPDEVQFYFLIQNVLSWKDSLEKMSDAEKADLSVRANIKFYTPRGGNPAKTGTFVAITDDEDPNVYFHTLQEDSEHLNKYLSETKRINWSSNPVFSCISDNHAELLRDLSTQFNCEYELLSDCSYYLITKQEAVNFQYKVPEDIIMKNLDPIHATLMNERWPHRYPGSEKYIALLIHLNGGIGLFTQTDELVAWVLMNEFAGIGHLQVMPSYRRRGFGELLAKAMSKQIATENDSDVNAFIVDKNINSINLFYKLGYKKIAGSNWVRARKNEGS
ncbi:uncharacterized protein LOC129762788 [Toxorhynchites rutilus septentrionalis]|uniref:uncharacterized protein LOC129762788 n=1 Tax=Toxorhynchites rutilus septentrionalis TaxID=329112 RepID=UPI00247A9DC8|nr:uncharacterized protein LOC129762788 [Toxorhynchites rutilus septentrionalis]